MQTVKQTSLCRHCYATSSPYSAPLSIYIDKAFSSGLATRDSPNTEVQTTQQHLCRTPVGGQVALADKLGANVDAIPLGIPTTGFAWHRLRIRRDQMPTTTLFKDGYLRFAPRLRLGHDSLARRQVNPGYK